MNIHWNTFLAHKLFLRAKQARSDSRLDKWVQRSVLLW